MITASIDTANRWTIVLSDGVRRHPVAVPATEGDRVDILCGDDLNQGYNYGIDAVVVVIKSGKIEQLIVTKNES